jgi:hypothetical protein
MSRVEDQGLSFLTITLPTFCKDFEKSLAEGFIDSKSFLNFKKFRKGPAFLRDLLSQVFNYETGRISDEFTSLPPTKSSIIIECVRQICLTFKKIKLPCSPQRDYQALEAFIKNERDFNCFPLPCEDDSYFKEVSRVLWDNMLYSISADSFIPKHGPGSTADKRLGNQKYIWRTWHKRLEPFFPIIGFAYPNSILSGDHQLELRGLSLVGADQECPSKVTLVPKTLKSPRIIALEPACMQYSQQAVLSILVNRIESYWLTAGHVNFTDQTVNQRKAVMSSFDRRYVTIDLSDASDRVPSGYALQMFSSNPDLKDAIESCRSTQARLPDGRIVRLRKFASMGSALCFPVEAMYFYTLCVMASLRVHNLPVSQRNIYICSRGIYVYGDDIVVPKYIADAVLSSLRKYNCKPNASKTFVNGNFRESCGVDAFKGVEITPTYLNEIQPENRQQASNLISWCAAANSFYKRGFFGTAQLLISKVESILGYLPRKTELSSILGRAFPSEAVPRRKWNRSLQRLEERCWVASPVYRTDKLDGHAALMKYFLTSLQRKTGDVVDKYHLERSALHGKVALKRRWVPVSIDIG